MTVKLPPCDTPRIVIVAGDVAKPLLAPPAESARVKRWTHDCSVADLRRISGGRLFKARHFLAGVLIGAVIMLPVFLVVG